MDVKQHAASDFHYHLPQDLIARHPLPLRDASRLLVSRGKEIQEDVFIHIAAHLPEGSLLVLNDSKVVHARLLFPKPSGAVVEVFCLEPILPVDDIHQAFACPSPVEWKCMIGNVRRWSSGSLVLTAPGIQLTATRLEDGAGNKNVHFTWDPPGLPFSALLETFGHVPIPPYLARKDEPIDKLRYQTTYARHDGSVAAPTAGLHFTDEVFKRLREKSIGIETLSLHVGAGTFLPVVSDTIGDHVMHQEQIHVTSTSLRRILEHQGPLIAVGTTSVRVIESLYWYGVSLVNGQESLFNLDQWEPYVAANKNVSKKDALGLILEHMDRQGLDTLSGKTRLMIVPPYRFRLVDGMITNFHQPGSTLIMLVAAFIGPAWREAYTYAIHHKFRFLSYGDACLFLP